MGRACVRRADACCQCSDLLLAALDPHCGAAAGPCSVVQRPDTQQGLGEAWLQPHLGEGTSSLTHQTRDSRDWAPRGSEAVRTLRKRLPLGCTPTVSVEGVLSRLPSMEKPQCSSPPSWRLRRCCPYPCRPPRRALILAGSFTYRCAICRRGHFNHLEVNSCRHLHPWTHQVNLPPPESVQKCGRIAAMVFRPDLDTDVAESLYSSSPCSFCDCNVVDLLSNRGSRKFQPKLHTMPPAPPLK